MPPRNLDHFLIIQRFPNKHWSMVTSHPPWDLCTTVRLQEAGTQSWDLDSAIALAPWFFGGSILGFFIGNLLLTCNLGGSFGWCVCVWWYLCLHVDIVVQDFDLLFILNMFASYFVVEGQVHWFKISASNSSVMFLEHVGKRKPRAGTTW